MARKKTPPDASLRIPDPGDGAKPCLASLGRRYPAKVDAVVRRLRKKALATKPGTLVGSEDALVARFEVSRPTLRQAAAVVCSEQLLEAKRGPGGGYISRRPDADGVAHMATIFLQARSTTLAEAMLALEIIEQAMLRAAARNRSPKARKAWEDFQARDEMARRRGRYRDFLRAERLYGALLEKESGSDVLNLFHQALHEFCASIAIKENLYLGRPDRIAEHWDLRAKVVGAIIAGDEALAVRTERRTTQVVLTWRSEDAAADRSEDPRVKRRRFLSSPQTGAGAER